MKPTTNDFIELLKTNAHKDPEAALLARLAKMGFGSVCGRCGGSGRYSFNLLHGTTCYGCSGLGSVKPKLTRELFERISEAVAAGALDLYLERMARKQQVEKAEKILDKITSESTIAADFHKEYEETTVRLSDYDNRIKRREMDPVIRDARFTQSRIKKEYTTFKQEISRPLYSRRNPATKEQEAEIYELLFQKFEEIRERLIAQETEYKASRVGSL